MSPLPLWDRLRDAAGRRVGMRRGKPSWASRFEVERLEGRELMAAGLAGRNLDLHGISAQGVVDIAPTGASTLVGPTVQSAGQVRGGVVSLRNVTYPASNGGIQLLDVYEPAAPPPPGGWPAVIAVHGGGWFKFDKSDFGRVVAPLAREGYAVLAVDYQLSFPGAPSWPANINDLRSAVRWVRQNSGTLGVDPTRIASLGESAGGHLATLLGMDPDGTPPGAPTNAGLPLNDSAQVQAVVDFYGPTDLTRLVQSSPESASRAYQFLGGLPSQVPDRYVAASPVTYVSPSSPPTLIIQGADDHIVPPAQSQELASVLRANGVPNRLILVPGAGHDGKLAPGFQFGGHAFFGAVLSFLNNALNH